MRWSRLFPAARLALPSLLSLVLAGAARGAASAAPAPPPALAARADGSPGCRRDGAPREGTTGPLPPEVARAVDAVLACERPDGGWTYVCDPPGGPHGAVTKIVVRATQIARLLGHADWDLLVLRSPGTPAAGLVLLEAYARTADPRYLEAARRAGDVLAGAQLPSGGWASEMPVHGDRLARWFRIANQWTALDDDVTSGAARFLVELWAATCEPRYRASAESAFALLLASQLEGGAWPLTWRPWLVRWLSPSFEDLPSTNDAATSGPIEALLAGARVLGRDDLLAAAERAGEWLLRVQGPERQAAWAQQYDAGGGPGPGRRFEPAGYAAWESREALDALLALARATAEDRWCAAVPGAVAWFARSRVAPGCWARLYAPASNVPLFVARDGRLVPSAAQAKRPYKWVGDYGIPGLLASLGLAGDGTPRDPDATRPPRRIPGDAGSCPGEPGFTTVERPGAPNPRLRIARAAARLAGLDPPRDPPCAYGAANTRPPPASQPPPAVTQTPGQDTTAPS